MTFYEPTHFYDRERFTVVRICWLGWASIERVGLRVGRVGQPEVSGDPAVGRPLHGHAGRRLRRAARLQEHTRFPGASVRRAGQLPARRQRMPHRPRRDGPQDRLAAPVRLRLAVRAALPPRRLPLPLEARRPGLLPR